MNKFFVFLSLGILLAQPRLEAAESQSYIDLMPLQLQYRYEDHNDQTRSTRLYSSWGLAYQFNWLRLGFEKNSYSSQTGNASSSVEEKISDFNLSAGYQIYEIHNQLNYSLSFWGVLGYGQTETQVQTKLLGVTTEQKSNPEPVLAYGLSAVGRIQYFLIELEGKILNSQDMSPQEVPTMTIKIGLTLKL